MESEKNDFTKEITDYKVAQLTDCNLMEVRVGTTGFKGGDTSHGCRTLFRLTNISSTDMRVGIDGEEPRPTEQVELAFGGDSELNTFKEALYFAYRELEKATAKMSLWERIKRVWKHNYMK